MHRGVEVGAAASQGGIWAMPFHRVHDNAMPVGPSYAPYHMLCFLFSITGNSVAENAQLMSCIEKIMTAASCELLHMHIVTEPRTRLVLATRTSVPVADADPMRRRLKQAQASSLMDRVEALAAVIKRPLSTVPASHAPAFPARAVLSEDPTPSAPW